LASCLYGLLEPANVVNDLRRRTRARLDTVDVLVILGDGFRLFGFWFRIFLLGFVLLFLGLLLLLLAVVGWLFGLWLRLGLFLLLLRFLGIFGALGFMFRRRVVILPACHITET
jgi:hypothetical protein